MQSIQMGIFGFCGGNKQMRRILLFMFLISMTGTMCSCSKTDSNEEYYKVYPTELNQEAARIYEVALDAFKNEDITKLENEFSEFAKENANLNDEIENAFEFIEGNITTIEDSDAGYQGGSKDEKGYVRADYAVYLFNVKTDKNRTYEIHIAGNFFYRNNEHKQGIYCIAIFDEDIEFDAATGNGMFRVGVAGSEL